MGCTRMEEDFAKMDVMKVTEEDLRERKRDREKVSEEFQHFLQQNLKKSPHDDNKSQMEEESQKVVDSLNVTQVVRNLNESPRSPLRSPGDGMKTQHGISSSVMSRESPKTALGGRTADESCKKVKNYDPVETRRYMRDQQRKRQVELKKSLVGDQVRKQEIQKRLAELQESTRRILDRSVKQKKATGHKVTRDAVKSVEKRDVKIVGTPKDTKEPQGVKTVDRDLTRDRDKSQKCRDKSSEGKIPLETLEVPKHLKLLKGEKKRKSQSLPHWLRPTPVNTYPYNFITAVREKLDAISHVQPLEKSSKPLIQEIPSSSSGSRREADKWTEIDRWSAQQEYNAKRGSSAQVMENTLKFSDSTMRGPFSLSGGVKKKSDAKSISEGLITHLSSVSLHVPDSNTISDISSIQSEIFPSSIRCSTKISGREQASVSDGGKGDNNQLSPLSVADTMRIMSPRGKTIAKESGDDGNNNDGGGKIGGNLSSDKFQPLDTSANKADIHEGNLTDLLEAFNQRLSQVIQIHKQLYTALNRSPMIQQEKNPADPQYEDSFEEANSTVKSAPCEKKSDQKPGDDATTMRESAEEINGAEGVDEIGEIDLGRGAVNCRDNNSSGEAKPEVRAIDARETNSTIGSDIFAVFNQTDMEVSYISSAGDDARETSISYSNIGLFEQMIKTEKMKGDQLMTMIRMREKTLIDRTRGQIAWLELQKKRFREKGRVIEISAIRKKQRAILLKLERERAQLQRQMRPQAMSTARKSPSHRIRVVEKTISNVVSLRRSPGPTENRGAVKGYEIEAGTTVEKLLDQREKELQKRREHVEFLFQWHQRLEREESEVREMEKKLLNCNLERLTEKNLPSLPALTDKAIDDDEAIKRVEDIDKSLQILNTIVQEGEVDFVEVRGAKLNHLWKKLIGREEEKFLIGNVYKMTKEDFSQLYEEAKDRVIKEFHDEKHIRQLLEESIASATRESVSQHSTEEEKPLKSGGTTEGYSTDDFETVAESEKPPEESSVREKSPDPEESAQEEESLGNPQEESQTFQSHSETIVNEARDLATESVGNEIQSTEEIFSPEILSQAEEEQLISEMTLPSFSETIGSEGLEENVQTEDRSEMIVENSLNEVENSLDNDLSVHSKCENLDKILNISQEESLNTVPDVDSVTLEQGLESVEDDGSKEIPSELEQRIIQVDVSLKDLSSTMEKSPILEALSPRETSPSTGSSNTSPEVSLQSTEESRASTSSEREENVSNCEEISPQESSSRFIEESLEVYTKSKEDEQGSGNLSQQKIRDYKIPNRMPDIISEAELLRRQQMQIEQEIKQLEQAVPAVFLREIPNKPPPPYVPPAQDSPLATIFPSEERVTELVNNRTKELFFCQAEADKSECHNITNVYEKIIVGMCEEMYGEIKETLDTPYDAPFQRVRLYMNKLAFFNPPDRLTCIQKHILESIGKILPGLGGSPRHTLPANSRRKRDQIDEIVIEEMLEDDWKWSNFQIEETEVLDTMTETIFSTLLEDAIRDIDVAFTRKFPPS